MANRGVRLAWQIAIVIFLVVAVCGIVAYVRVSETVGNNTERRYAEHVQRAAIGVADQITSTQALVLTGTRLLGNGPAFVEKVASGNVAAALETAVSQREIAASAVSQQTGMVIYDPQGKLLFRVHAPVDRSSEAMPETVAAAVRGESFASLRTEPSFGLSISAASQMKQADGRVVGIIEVLTKVDQTLAVQLSRRVGAEVAIVTPMGVIASSREDLQPTIAELDAARGIQSQPWDITLGNREYLAMAVPLRSVSGAEFGLVYVGVDRQQIVMERTEAQREVLAASGVALLIGAALAAGLGAVLSRPVTSLVTAARRIRENDLDSPVTLAGPSELRQLGMAMEEMRLAVREARSQLLGQNANLTTRVESSTAGLSEATIELSAMHTLLTGSAQAAAEAPRVAAEQLMRLAWVAGAAVAIPGADERPLVAAERGFVPGAATAVLDVLQHDFDAAARTEGVFVEDMRSTSGTRLLRSHQIEALAVVPLQPGAETAGYLVVAAARGTHFTEHRRNLLRAFASELLTATERHDLVDEIEGSRRLAESVLREMQDGAIVLDEADRCWVCNAAAARMLNIDRNAVIGQPAAGWLPLSRAALARLRRHAFEDEEPQPVTIERNERLFAITAGALPDRDPAQRGLILLLRDVTDSVAAERTKQEFISMIGHELRTPLTLIRTSIDLLTEEGAGGLSPTQARITEVLQNNSERLLHLINDLLDMSAIDSGRLQIHPDLMPLDEAVREVLEGFEQEQQEQRLTFEVDMPPEEVRVWADRLRVRQVLSNLVSNAVKYTPPGGHVRVRVAPGEEFARIEVTDNGIGVLPEEQPLLFQKFQRTTTGARQSGGTGLGLAIARSIVELHGGEIWCESDGRTGSTFSFTLPCHEPGAERASA